MAMRLGASTESATCAEAGCTAPRRRLLRYDGGSYLSDFCWAHSCRCVVCGGEIDDGEDFCVYDAAHVGVRYETDVPEEDRREVLARLRPPPLPPAGAP